MEVPLLGDSTLERLHTTGVLRSHVNVPFAIDLDTCAEINVVSIDFVRKHKLQWIGDESPRIRFMDHHFAKVCGVYQVPLSLTDCQGVTREAIIPYIVVERSPFRDDSPVILGIPVLNTLSILLFLQVQS